MKDCLRDVFDSKRVKSEVKLISYIFSDMQRMEREHTDVCPRRRVVVLSMRADSVHSQPKKNQIIAKLWNC